MTRFWLLRHGSHDWLGRVLVGRVAGVSLNANGQHEAEILARVLAPRPLAAIYASPVQRAGETAAPIALDHGLSITTAEALTEIDFGEWTEQTFDELELDPRWRRWNAHRASAAAPSGESMRAVERRVVRFMEELCARHDGEEVALVSHGDVLRAALAHHLGMSLDQLHSIHFPPGALALLELHAETACLRELCSNTALAEELSRTRALAAALASA